MKFESFPNKISLSSPTMYGDEIKYIDSLFHPNEQSNIIEIEKMISEITGRKYAIPVSNGTSALHLAVKLSGVKQNDVVLCSTMTFVASANPILYEKAKPVFVDVEYDTWNMSPKALEKAFEKYPKAKAIIVTDLYGTSANYSEIQRIAKNYGVTIIQDAAESFGTKYKEKPSTVYGDISAISFNCNKIITGTSGGMLLTDNEEISSKARKLSNQAKELSPWYQHEEIGYNYRMSEVVAGVIRAQLPHLEKHISRKKEIYDRYNEGLKSLPITMNPFNENECSPNFWLSCMLIDKSSMCEQKRDDKTSFYTSEKGKSCPDEILNTLKKYNVEGRPIWKPMHMQPLYKNSELFTAEEGVDISADIFERGLCLPSDIKMTKKEQDVIIEMVKSCFD